MYKRQNNNLFCLVSLEIRNLCVYYLLFKHWKVYCFKRTCRYAKVLQYRSSTISANIGPDTLADTIISLALYHAVYLFVVAVTRVCSIVFTVCHFDWFTMYVPWR